MWAVANAHERDMDEWNDLFAMANPRFKILGVTKPSGSVLSIIEVIWDSECN